MRKRLALVLVAIAVVACSKPRIDATSDETLEKSMGRVRTSVPEAKRDQLGKDIMLLAFQNQAGGLLGLAAMAKSDHPAASLMKPLHGKTADEIMAAAARVRSEQEAKERAQAFAEIKELEEKKAGADKARTALRAFEVLSSRYTKRSNGFMEEVRLVLTVKNGTPSPISRAYFVGTLSSPGRAVPWLQKDFNYDIPGGLEPGEGATWSLNPGMFEGWEVDAAKDAVFTVEVVRLDGPDHKPVYDAAWSKEEEDRLEGLRKGVAS
jgi:hypothetical protein